MHIAICDDEKNICVQMKEMLKPIQLELELDLEVVVYETGEALHLHLECGGQPDVIFLDIELIKMSGIDIGHYIRDIKKDYNTKIIYISSKEQYAYSLISTSPFDFMIKPIKKEKLVFIIKKLREAMGNQDQVFQYKNGGEVKQIPYRNILYFTSDGHWVEVHFMVSTKEGRNREKKRFYGKMKQVLSNVPCQFWEIHKSYIVNSDYIETCRYDRLYMRGEEEIPISRAYQKETKAKVQKILRERAGSL